MKFKITRSLLDSTLNYVSKGLSTKTPLPILMGIYINVTADNITLISTNKEISTKVVLENNDELTIIDPGYVVAPGKYLCDIVKKIDDGEIEISCYEDSNIKILSKASDFTLTPYNSFAYPDVNFDINGSEFNISSREFKKMIKKTSFACGLSEARMWSTGVLFEINNDEFCATATDSYRLSKRNTLINNTEGYFKVNVPSHSLEDLVKVLPETDELIQINVSNNIILFKFNNVFFMSRLIEDNFPPTRNLFIRQNVCEIDLNRQEFIQAVDRASLFTAFDNSINIKLTLINDILEIASASSELGKVVVKINPLNIQGNLNFSISFNSKNTIEACKAFDSEKIKFTFVSENRPGLIISEEEPELYEILLPIMQN